MRASDIMLDIIGEEFLREHPDTVDTCKAGDPDREVARIGVCMTATPHVIREAAAWGADLLITHEPTFYDHYDRFLGDKLSQQKKALVDESGLTIWRYHDSMHLHGEDEISREFVERLGFPGAFDGRKRLEMAEPHSAEEIAKRLKTALPVGTARIIGDLQATTRRLWLLLGQTGEEWYHDFFEDSDAAVAVCGELCEWKCGEPVRDLTEFGTPKAMVVIGHVGSERFGMEALCRRIDGQYDGAPTRYFECGELYNAV
ncbi:MAG: Nif3-like dinuclear metal center hexameric protein [Clostridia bacterium]|nr:Nif3-like dinuclear metal center hexameric protein [Clostridia bacterium]